MTKLLLVVASTMLLGHAQAQVRCLRYEPEVVVLHGSVTYRTFADANDRPERVPLLLLDEPICVEAERGYTLNVSEGDQVVVHLNADPAKFGHEQDLSGKRITATGTLYHAHTAHHHAPLLLMVQELRFEDPNKALQPTRATGPNGKRDPARIGPRG